MPASPTVAPQRNGTGTYVGVDVGGTHTDVIIAHKGTLTRAKALTTHDDYARGLLEAVELAAASLGLTLEHLLAGCDAFVNATTLVTNAITERRGAAVGFLATHGFRDVFRIAGGPRKNAYDDHEQTNVPDLLERDAIAEVRERIDYRGEVLVPLLESDVRDHARVLVEELDVEAIAVGFLWSFKNPAHELRARELIRERYPDVEVTLSHEVYPVIREHERWTTALLNAFVQPAVTRYIDRVEAQLRGRGLTGRLSFFQGLGGTISPADARRFPLFLLGSGPAGGVMGATALARALDRPNVICADMGGTSFDAAIIEDYGVRIEKRRAIDQLETGLNAIDIVSIGAGGGSIAWIDSRGVPQVGPASAGSSPGPACYGRGGSEATVTDAMLLLGYIDPADYLGGRFTLQLDAASTALNRLAAPLGWSSEEIAAAIRELVIANMANALREVSVEKGRDPREFTLLAYGGTLPLFVADIARSLQVAGIVIPANSSAFSAFGLLTTDYLRRFEQTVEWDTSDTEAGLRYVNTVAEELEARAHADLRANGFAPEQSELIRTGEFRFAGQVWELTMPIAATTLTSADAARFADDFPRVYEQTYGPGTAWKGMPVVLLNYGITAVGRQHKPEFTRTPEAASPDPSHALQGSREVFSIERESRIPLPVYDDRLLRPGNVIEGPAIVNAHDTTISVPERFLARRDELMNYHLSESDTDA